MRSVSFLYLSLSFSGSLVYSLFTHVFISFLNVQAIELISYWNQKHYALNELFRDTVHAEKKRKFDVTIGYRCPVACNAVRVKCLDLNKGWKCHQYLIFKRVRSKPNCILIMTPFERSRKTVNFCAIRIILSENIASEASFSTNTLLNESKFSFWSLLKFKKKLNVLRIVKIKSKMASRRSNRSNWRAVS